MSDEKPFFQQLDEIDDLLAEANRQSEDESEQLELFSLPKRPPLPAFDQLPPSYKTLRNLRNNRRVIE